MSLCSNCKIPANKCTENVFKCKYNQNINHISAMVNTQANTLQNMADLKSVNSNSIFDTRMERVIGFNPNSVGRVPYSVGHVPWFKSVTYAIASPPPVRDSFELHKFNIFNNTLPQVETLQQSYLLQDFTSSNIRGFNTLDIGTVNSGLISYNDIPVNLYHTTFHKEPDYAKDYLIGRIDQMETKLERVLMKIANGGFMYLDQSSITLSYDSRQNEIIRKEVECAVNKMLPRILDKLGSITRKELCNMREEIDRSSLMTSSLNLVPGGKVINFGLDCYKFIRSNL